MGAMKRPVCIAATALAAVLLGGCRSASGPEEIPTGDVPPEARSLTRIVAELQMHLRDDTYRFHRAARPDGQNVFAVALWQLDRLARARDRAPEEWENVDVVIEYARGRAFERQRRYADARDAYARVETAGSLLGASAEQAQQVMARFARHAGPPRDPLASPEAELAWIDRRVEKWRSLAWEYRGTTYEPLAREEAESWNVLRVDWYARHAGPAEAVVAARRLVEDERNSKLHGRHLIRLGDLCAEAARHEHVRARAGLAAFDAARYQRWLDQALAAYELAGEVRRSEQREEADGKIAALLAYHQGVRAYAP
jgi:hypothetical protein